MMPQISLIFIMFLTTTHALSMSMNGKSRRQVLEKSATSLLVASSAGTLLPVTALAAAEESSSSSSASAVAAAPSYAKNGLASRLAQRDPAVLKNKVFNVPPSAQVYPDWLRGNWEVTSSFNGFIFPSRKIPKEKLTQDFNVAGFQKCSIAATADVGKDNVRFVWSVDETSGLEDRTANLQREIDAYLGYRAVKGVIYDAKANPNRIGVDFVDYKTVNAERIELFCNARESESYVSADGLPVFVCSEYARQVTFGTGSTPGVPRQISTNYANFWTWQKKSDGTFKGNLLTAAFLDPQDPLYFDEPSLPVAIYSHVFTGRKLV